MTTYTFGDQVQRVSSIRRCPREHAAGKPGKSYVQLTALSILPMRTGEGDLELELIRAETPTDRKSHRRKVEFHGYLSQHQIARATEVGGSVKYARMIVIHTKLRLAQARRDRSGGWDPNPPLDLIAIMFSQPGTCWRRATTLVHVSTARSRPYLTSQRSRLTTIRQYPVSAPLPATLSKDIHTTLCRLSSAACQSQCLFY
jgi:hypothetical protein